jgi:hypothetical protein
MFNGNDDMCILAACAVSALIIRPSAAIGSICLDLIGDFS